MSKRVKVSKICLQIDGKKIELTMKQAQELKDVLNDTFGQTVTEYIYPRPYWGHPYWSYGQIACGTTTVSSADIARPSAYTNWASDYQDSTLTITTQ